MAQMVYIPRTWKFVMVARRHVNGLLGGSSVVLRLVPPGRLRVPIGSPVPGPEEVPVRDFSVSFVTTSRILGPWGRTCACRVAMLGLHSLGMCPFCLDHHMQRPSPPLSSSWPFCRSWLAACDCRMVKNRQVFQLSLGDLSCELEGHHRRDHDVRATVC